MTKAADKYLERVKEIVLGHLEGHEARVFLFGSHARGNAWRFSDVDVAIDPRLPLPPELLAEMKDALEESTVPWRVDLVDLSTASAEFRERVLREGTAWSVSRSD